MANIESSPRSESKRSKESVYGEGIKTHEEEGRPLNQLREELDSGNVKLIGSSIVGSEVDTQTQDLINQLHELEQLGASVFCGENIQMETEDGGVLVIGDDCVIYDTKIKVAKGCTLLLEKATLLGCEVTVTNGEYRITTSYMKQCRVYNSSISEVNAQESAFDTSLLRGAHFITATLNSCIGSLGGSELGGVYINKNFSYHLNPGHSTSELRVEDISAVNPHFKNHSR